MTQHLSRRTPAGLCSIAAIVGSLAIGCQQQGQAPEPKSAAGQAAYAERYPEELSATTDASVNEEREVQTTINDVETFPNQLKKTDYALVRRVYELADEEGRSGSYASAADDVESVSRFYAEQKEPLSRQVAGSARYAAKDKGATDPQSDAAASGAAFGLEKGLGKQIEEHLRSRSDADRLIDDREDDLGKSNVEPLRKQAAAISRASYLVHVAAPRERVRLEKLVDEASAVRRTLDRTIEEAAAVESDAGASAKRKKTAKVRKSAAEEARAKLDATSERAKTQLNELEKRQKDLAAKYDAALSKLLDAVEKRAKEAPVTKDAPS